MRSDKYQIRRQRGMTLFEMLVVLTIISLLCGLLFSPALTGLKSRSLASHARDDFAGWYVSVQQSALYESRLHRICTDGKRFTGEYYQPSMGWHNTSVTYIPPQGVTFDVSGKRCSEPLNTDSDDFIHNVHFQINF
ncbi:type II secretion system protein [Enterobacter kobei]|uniref:type II secretion system protein n=1 Tax=Enterobacter kobei TaxID=208224 RepID=UPI003CE79644